MTDRVPSGGFIMRNGVLLLILSLVWSGCSNFQRSLESGYFSRETQQEVFTPSESKDYDSALYELGLFGKANNLSPSDSVRLKRRVKVKQLERLLQSQMEKQQYYKYKPFFRSDLERLSFLSYPSYDEKESWLAKNGFLDRQNYQSEQEKKAIEQSDVLEHMTMQAVRESWGEPDKREISGNRLYGNERWTYNHYSSTESGFNSEKRVLYFENGRLKSWNSTPQ